jgi:shikimate kinase
MRLSLIGMPGAGKTTLGQALAVAYEVPFIDLDREIFLRERRSITTIFELEGEKYFREREAAVLREVVQGAESFVLSTGGGTPCFHHNLELLLEVGFVLYLEVPVEALAQRMLQSASMRPLLAGATDAEALVSQLRETLEARKQFYDRAPLRCTPPTCTLVGVRRLIDQYTSTA